MWSLTKPSGTMSTALRPRAGSSAIASLMSGSSHGTCGGPERLWKTSCQAHDEPSRDMIVSATAVCCAT
jgi:hypothetical protein